VCPEIKPVVLRALYRDLTNDLSAPNDFDEAMIDERMKLVLDMEDPSVVVDLRHLNTSNKSKYDVFWDECQKFLQEGIGSAIDDRLHQTVTHMAAAVSVSDLLEEVKRRCPNDTDIPSVSWLRLQFWPKTAHAKLKTHYTGKLNVKFMVQARQSRKDPLHSSIVLIPKGIFYPC